MNVLLVRHGEIPSNVQRVYAGTSKEGLTEKGLVQAREVSKKLSNYSVHTLHTSPIQRAIQTAKIISDSIGKKYIIESAFREMELGLWEGLSEDDIAESYKREWQIWQNRPAELRLEGRETLEQLLERVLKGVRAIYQGGSDKTVVIVTHVAIIRVLLLWRNAKSLNLYKTIHVPNAEIFDIKVDF